jgi:hypothetical protein
LGSSIHPSHANAFPSATMAMSIASGHKEPQ